MGVVEDATRAELDAHRAAELVPGLAAVAMRLAKQLDRVTLKAPTSAAVVARELRAALQEVRKVVPAQQEGDGLDELASRRAARLSEAVVEDTAGGDP